MPYYFKVKWIFNNDESNHFFIRHGDGNWTEYRSNSAKLEFKFERYDEDDSPILFRLNRPNNIFLKLTNTNLIRAFRRMENFNTSRDVKVGRWETKLQAGKINKQIIPKRLVIYFFSKFIFCLKNQRLWNTSYSTKRI